MKGLRCSSPTARVSLKAWRFPIICDSQELAVTSGHWPLFRYDPRRRAAGKIPLQLDSKKPTIPFKEFAKTEMRFNVLTRTQPDRAEQLLRQAQREVDERFQTYQQLAGMSYPSDSL